jgi:hypothetical protein
MDMQEAEVRALDALRDRLSLRSRADAVRTALAILEWVEGETGRGRRVVAIGDEEVSRLVVPGLTTELGSSSPEGGARHGEEV